MTDLEDLAQANLKGDELEGFLEYAGATQRTAPDHRDAGSLENLIEAAWRFDKAFECLKAVLKAAFEIEWTQEEIFSKLVEIRGREETELREMARALFESQPVQ
jgi:hypothetical protein